MLTSSIFDKPIYKWWVFSTVALGTLTSVINHGGMSVALPTIAQHFDADLSTAQWVVIAKGLAISAPDAWQTPQIVAIIVSTAEYRSIFSDLHEHRDDVVY